MHVQSGFFAKPLMLASLLLVGTLAGCGNPEGEVTDKLAQAEAAAARAEAAAQRAEAVAKGTNAPAAMPEEPEEPEPMVVEDDSPPPPADDNGDIAPAPAP